MTWGPRARGPVEKSEGLFTFKEGTLYPILHTLEVEQLVESYWDEEGGRKRKYYRITDKGRRELGLKRQEWSLFSSAVSRIVGEGNV